MKVKIYLNKVQEKLETCYQITAVGGELMNEGYGLYHFKSSRKGEFVPVYVWRYKSNSGTISIVLELLEFSSYCLNTYVRLKADTINKVGYYQHKDDLIELTIPVSETGVIQQLNYHILDGSDMPYFDYDKKFCQSRAEAQKLFRIQMWNESFMYQGQEPQVQAMKGAGCLGLGYGYKRKGESRGWFMCLINYGRGRGFLNCPIEDLSTRGLGYPQIIYDRVCHTYFELEKGIFSNPRPTKIIHQKWAEKTWQAYLQEMEYTDKKRFKKIESYKHPIAMYRDPWLPSSRVYYDAIPCWLLGIDEEKIYFIDTLDFNRVTTLNRSCLERMKLANPNDKNFTL